MIRCLMPLVRLWCLAYYSWALREIHYSSPDIPFILERLAYWREVK